MSWTVRFESKENNLIIHVTLICTFVAHFAQLCDSWQCIQLGYFFCWIYVQNSFKYRIYLFAFLATQLKWNVCIFKFHLCLCLICMWQGTMYTIHVLHQICVNCPLRCTKQWHKNPCTKCACAYICCIFYIVLAVRKLCVSRWSTLFCISIVCVGRNLAGYFSIYLWYTFDMQCHEVCFGQRQPIIKSFIGQYITLG